MNLTHPKRALARDSFGGPEAEGANAVVREGEVGKVLINPHGDVDALLLRDGAQIRLRPRPADDRLVPGAKVHVEGLERGSVIKARKIVFGDGTEATEPTPPPPPDARRPGDAPGDLPTPPRAPRDLDTLEVSSTLTDVVVDPEGRPDTLILSDGSLVKIPPGLREELKSPLRAGARVSARGDGGIYGKVKSLHAHRLQIDGGPALEESEPIGLPLPPPEAP